MKKHVYTLLMSLALSLAALPLFAQEDLLSLLGEEEETTDYATASFKTSRVINLHSLENTASGVLDFKISHRFNTVQNGLYDFFGLDGANLRIGFDYGVTDRLVVGIGRSNYEKTLDGFAKYKILRQSKGKRNMPVTLAAFGSVAMQTLKWANPDRDNHFSSRLYYTGQLIIGRKISEGFSLQLSPTIVHRNLVATFDESNDVLALGIGTRIKLTKRMAINLEYIYVLPDQLAPQFVNSLSVGLDIETGGHVFQLHFSNSRIMVEKGFIAETTNKWEDGGIHFGFNISRVFTIVRAPLD
ncbi:MAG: DUF5777 family beta-barrel protein [Saprospiraceae bacterium]